jgi:hypothetical protein
MNLEKEIAALRRSRNAQVAGKARRANEPYAVLEVCNKVKRGDVTQRCCRVKGHSREHIYITAVGPIMPRKARKP